jgi:hypothetical protein
MAEYFRRSRDELRNRKWLFVAVALFVSLGGTNAALALSQPADSDAARAVFAASAILRVLALFWIGVAALRRATGSRRGAWLPDGGFWLYSLLSLLGLAGPVLAGVLSLGLPVPARIAVMQLAAVLILLPIAPWQVAAAVERPLAWSPGPWVTRLGAWLGPLALLSLLTTFPLAWLHAWLSEWLLAMPERAGFVGLALADGLVTTLLVVWTLALQLTAYRRVAQG